MVMLADSPPLYLSLHKTMSICRCATVCHKAQHVVPVIIKCSICLCAHHAGQQRANCSYHWPLCVPSASSSWLFHAPLYINSGWRSWLGTHWPYCGLCSSQDVALYRSSSGAQTFGMPVRHLYSIVPANNTHTHTNTHIHTHTHTHTHTHIHK